MSTEKDTRIEEIKQDIEHALQLRSKYPYLSNELHYVVDSLNSELERLEKEIREESNLSAVKA